METSSQVVNESHDSVMDKRGKFNAFLKEHILSVRKDFTNMKYRFLDQDSLPVLSEKTYQFANLVSLAFIELYSKCEKNKKKPEYWKEGGVGLAGLFLLIGHTIKTPFKEASTIQPMVGAAAVMAAGSEAYAKSKQHEERLKSAIALTSIINNAQALENISISLSVSLAYRLGNIIEILEQSPRGVGYLAKLLSCQIADYILKNTHYFDSESHLHGMVLKNAIPGKDSQFYKQSYFRNKKIIGSNRNEINLELLLTTSPAYDAVGTIYYKDGENKPFQYPFQKLLNSEEASHSGYKTFLDVTECWNMLLGEHTNIEKLHVGSQDLEQIPLVFHQDIYNYRDAVLKGKSRISNNNGRLSSNINSEIEELLQFLKEYLNFINQVRRFEGKKVARYPQHFMTNFASSLSTGETKSIQIIMYLKQAVLTADEIIDYTFENFSEVFKNSDKAVHAKELVKCEIQPLHTILDSYKELYISLIEKEDVKRCVSSLPSALQERIGFIPPNISQPQFATVEPPPSKWAAFLDALNLTNLNKSAEQLLDMLGIKHDVLRKLIKIGGGIIIMLGSSSLIYYLLPETISILGSRVLGHLVLGGGLGFVVTTLSVNFYPTYLEYQKKHVAHQRRIQRIANSTLSTDRAYLENKHSLEMTSDSKELNKEVSNESNESTFQYKLERLQNYFQNNNDPQEKQFNVNLRAYRSAANDQERRELEEVLSSQYDALIPSSPSSSGNNSTPTPFQNTPLYCQEIQKNLMLESLNKLRLRDLSVRKETDDSWAIGKIEEDKWHTQGQIKVTTAPSFKIEFFHSGHYHLLTNDAQYAPMFERDQKEAPVLSFSSR